MHKYKVHSVPFGTQLIFFNIDRRQGQMLNAAQSVRTLYTHTEVFRSLNYEPLRFVSSVWEAAFFTLNQSLWCSDSSCSWLVWFMAYKTFLKTAFFFLYGEHYFQNKCCWKSLQALMQSIETYRTWICMPKIAAWRRCKHGHRVNRLSWKETLDTHSLGMMFPAYWTSS